MTMPPHRTGRSQTAAIWLAVLVGILLPISGLSADRPPNAAGTDAVKLVFEGNRLIGEETLRKAAEREITDFKRLGGRESDINDAAFQMEITYRNSGFPFAEIDYRIEENGEGLRATFMISEGPRVIIDKIRFRGLTVFKPEELTALFEQNHNKSVGSGELVYVKDDIESAVGQIRDIYRSRGYLDVVIPEPDIRFENEKTAAVITVTVEENRRYVVRDIRFEGDVVDAARSGLDRLRADLVGQPFYPRQRFTLQKRILSIYGNIGYADAEAQIDTESVDRPQDVLLLVAIASGPLVTIENVEIRGNERTREQFIRSRLQLKAGDTFSIEKKQNSFRELYRTGLFSTVDLNLAEGDTGEGRRLVVTVTEAPAKEVYLEFGWGSYEKLRLRFGFRESNLLGTGRIFEANTKFSLKAQGAGISLIDPWFLNTDTTAELPFEFERREEPSFTREDLTASFLLTRELTRNVTMIGGYAFQRTSITEVEITGEDQNQDEDYDLASVKAQIGYDTRDDIFFPTGGQKSFLSVEYADDVLGGSISFVRLAGGLRYYFELSKTTVLAMRYSTGLIIPGPDQIGIPLGERFFNGGENSVRSFEEGQLGPKDDSNDPTGGLAFNIISLELRQRLAGRFSGSLFIDVGNVAPNRSRAELGKPPYNSRSEVWQDTLQDFFADFRPALGVGLQYMLPFGPARLDVAVNPDRDSERDESLFAWHFSIGMAF